MKPPQDLKSANMAGVVNGNSNPDRKKRSKSKPHCGMLIQAVTGPRVQAKMNAVNKSKTDFASRML